MTAMPPRSPAAPAPSSTRYRRVDLEQPARWAAQVKLADCDDVEARRQPFQATAKPFINARYQPVRIRSRTGRIGLIQAMNRAIATDEPSPAKSRMQKKT